MTEYFFHIDLEKLGCNRMRLRSRPRKSRTRPSCTRERVTCSRRAHVVRLYLQPECHINGVDMLSNTRIYVPMHTAIGVHDVVRALLSFSRRPFGPPGWCAGRVVYVRARERVAQLREIGRRSFTNSQRPKFWPRKRNEDTSYQFPSRADVSRMFSCSLKHLLFTAFLRKFFLGNFSTLAGNIQLAKYWFTRDRDSCVDIQFTSLQRKLLLLEVICFMNIFNFYRRR